MKTSYKIRNYKISFKVKELNWVRVIELLKQENIKVSFFHNFIVFKSRYIYTLFKPRVAKPDESHVNVTQLKSKSKICKAVSIFEKLVQCTVTKETVRVDNITASGFFPIQSIDLQKFYQQHSREVQIKYNRDKFPGAFVKTEQGTALLFHTGKVVFVGCRERRQIKCQLRLLKSLMMKSANALTPIVWKMKT